MFAAVKAALLHVVLQTVVALATSGAEPQTDANSEDIVSMLQTTLRIGKARASSAADPAKRDLVFMHIPYNFGHTIEQYAAYGPGPENRRHSFALMKAYGGLSGASSASNCTPNEVLASHPLRPGAIMWGHLHPDLQIISNVTGCALFYTPPKFWPDDIAKRYFGKKIIFGLLRDPYEKLIAMFRGDFQEYGGSYPEYRADCDVNGAVKSMMRRYLAKGSGFDDACTFIPQAEYFDGPYGIQLSVDNRQFPRSMNTVFLQHGYPDMVINQTDIIHVRGCNEKWAADLDAEARQLVRQVYRRDFELLCKHFGYCDPEENACIWQVPKMCPDKVLAAGYRGHAL